MRMAKNEKITNSLTKTKTKKQKTIENENEKNENAKTAKLVTQRKLLAYNMVLTDDTAVQR